jgi:hypothetical protein
VPAVDCPACAGRGCVRDDEATVICSRCDRTGVVCVDEDSGDAVSDARG